MAVSIRPAGDGDRTAICAVHVRAIHETCSRSYSSEQVDAWAGLLSADSYTAVLRERFLIVAMERGRVVGFGQLDPDAAEVDAVYVLPERQGEGIGRQLLSQLEARARALGIATLELSATLNAEEFYQRAGYERRRVVVHRLPNGVELQCIRMSKPVESQGRSTGSEPSR